MQNTQDEKNRQSEYIRKNTDPVFLEEVEKIQKEYKGKIKVLIAEPSIGMVDYQAHDAAWDLAFNLARYENESDYKFFKTTIGRLMVGYAREKFAEYACEVGFDYIFFIDDDHYWEADMFRKLQKYIKDYDIVAPLCVQRAEPFYPVIYTTKVIHEDENATYYDNLKYSEEKGFKKGDLITDADAIGFGCAIVKVNLLKKMPQPWFFGMQGVGEDIQFCIKAKAVGAKILVDTNIEAPHLQDRKFASWRDYEKIKRDNAVLPGSESKKESTELTDK